MKTAHLVKALEEVARQLGLEVRWEKGNFRGGVCKVNGQDLVLLNRHHPAEAHLSILAESLRAYPTESIYLRPAVREALDTLLQRHPETLRDTLLEPDQEDVG